jgi:hypothetical protein
MFRIEYLPPGSAWTPDAGTVGSFDGGWRAGRIHGAARFVRFLSHAGQAPEGQTYAANRQDGAFWLAEERFLQIKVRAEADLKRQPGAGPGRTPNRLAMYLRHEFRCLLAVRRDWTPSFDYLARLTIPHGESVVALIGKIKEQPVYSPAFPGEASAREAGLKLEGGLIQYVIWFDFPANVKARNWITSPLPV